MNTPAVQDQMSGQSFRQACVCAFGLAFKYIQLTASTFSRHPVMVSPHKSSLAYFAVTLSFVGGVIAVGHIVTLIWFGVVPLFLGSIVLVLAMLFDACLPVQTTFCHDAE